MKKPLALVAAVLTAALPLAAQETTPEPAPVGAAAGEQTATLPPPDLLLISGIPYAGTDAQIVAFAENAAKKAALIEQPNLQYLLRFALAEIREDPRNAAKIRREYLGKLSNLFYESAIAEKKADRPEQAVAQAQLAVRIDPANVIARYFFADLLEQIGNPDGAVQTLQFGKRTLSLNDPIAPRYLEFYYKLLRGKQRDRDIIEDTDTLLAKKGYLADTREVIAYHGAQANYWLGDYKKALETLAEGRSAECYQERKRMVSALAGNEKTVERAQEIRFFSEKRFADTKILEANILFAAGDTAKAIKELENAVTLFSGTTRDAILSQLGRFHSQLGQYDEALAVANRRIAESPADDPNPYPRIQRLYLFEKIGKLDLIGKEVGDIITKFGHKQGAMLALAEYGSKYGRTAVCTHCATVAEEHQFDLSLFTLLVIESLIRAGDPQGAISYYKAVLDRSANFFHGVQGSVNALIGIAYIQNKIPLTGRAFLNDFLLERKTDKQTLDKIRELEIKRDGKSNAAGEILIPAQAKSYQQKREISDEIKRITYRQRKISPGEYVSVAYFLRFVNAPQDALRILENGVYTCPDDSQVLADFISARLVCNALEERGTRKPILEDIERLLSMRRPMPTVWTDILNWLDNGGDKTMPTEKATALRSTLEKLIRPDLDFSLMRGVEPE